MNDIENIDIDDIEINNPYSKNPFWSKDNKVTDIDSDDFEYNQKLKKYAKVEKDIEQLLNILNFKHQKIGIIFGCVICLVMYLLSIICGTICIKDNNITTAKDIFIFGYVFVGLGVYCLIELSVFLEKEPLRKTDEWKKFQKFVLKNKKTIIKEIKKNKTT